MEKQFFHQVTGELECTFFERITEDSLFWDDVRSNINCALLMFFKNNCKKKHLKNFLMVCDFFVEGEQKKQTFTAPFEVNKGLTVEKFQDTCAMRLCSHLVKKAREILDKDNVNAFSVSFVEGLLNSSPKYASSYTLGQPPVYRLFTKIVNAIARSLKAG